MLDFSDEPYRDYPPKDIAFWRQLLGWYNRKRFLSKSKRIAELTVHGTDTLRQAAEPGDRLVLMPNHPTHADAAIMLEACRQAGLTTQMMAAYDVFLRSWLDAFIMQRLGAFSVDREGSDPRAMKTALSVLEKGKHALVVFPEGNVYLENDRVTPFSEGAAFLALRAAHQLKEQGNRVLAVPVSIKATHLTDCRPLVVERLQALAKAVEAGLPADAKPVEAMRLIGVALLHRNLKLRGLDTPEADDFHGLISHAGGVVMDKLEAKLDITLKADAPLIDRVRKARQVIHEVRTDPERVADHAAAATWADEAMLALRLASYSDSYVASSPTLDRIEETSENLAEDLHRKMMPPIADRAAYVRFNEPIPLCEYVAEKRAGRKQVRGLTARCESAVQRGVDMLSEANPHPGGQQWDGPMIPGPVQSTDA
ncbi:MAG: lysophospholipid acyltransferase family protein [Planctomycetota bacterium]